MSRGKQVSVLLVAAFVLSACASTSEKGTASPSKEPSQKPAGASSAVVEVPADAETEPTQHSGDSADDPAIWVDEQDPARSLVIGNDKQGALETYDLDGSLVERIESSTTFWGNVDVRQDVPLPSGASDVVAVANNGLRLYAVNPETRKLSPLTADGASLDTGGGEGVCLYANPDGGLSVFMVFISGNVRQFALEDDGAGGLALDQVREFEVGSEAEGCMVDDQNHALYISEENVGLWRYDADPAGGDERVMIDELKPEGHGTADIEGVTLVDDGSGKGLIITSSQAPFGVPSYFNTFDRATGAYRSSFRIADGPNADGCSHTDGITATAEPLGPDYPEGVFICQDDENTSPGVSGNQNFKLTRLENVRP